MAPAARIGQLGWVQRSPAFLGLALLLVLTSARATAAGPARTRPAPVKPPVAAPVAPPPAARPPPPSLPAWPLYDRLCLACHGRAGDGAGPAAPWLWPRPRDLRAGVFQWHTTADGAATRADLARTIATGAPGTSMPGFADVLDPAQLEALVDVVIAFGPDRAVATAGEPLPVVPAVDADGRARGQALFTRLGCVSCHGPAGKGDGPAAAALAGRRPYDVTAGPIRRPRATADDAGRRQAIAASITWGVGGTPMAAFGGQLSADELAALVGFVDGLGPHDAPMVPALDAAAIADDRARKATEAGYRPGAADDPDGALFGGTIALQGGPPPSLPPAGASLSARQCGRCHARQLREWQGTLHARAASPGLEGQLVRLTGAAAESCRRCHAPLAEQQPTLRPGQRGGDDADRTYTASAAFDRGLADEGLTCAACHVRGWRRHGPPPSPSLLPAPGYPVTVLPVYERGDLCLGCHQLPPRLAVAGRPLLDTYREWLLGPYMRRGVQCQHCHMPNREHTWKGVHDPETFRQGLALTGRVERTAQGAVVASAIVTNVGAGHYLPTTPTPAAWLELELVDAAGRPLAGTRASRRIGRELRYGGSGFEQVEDTRIPPGGSLSLDRTWPAAAVSGAAALRVVVRVKPDDYYEGLYRRRLAGKLPAEARRQFEDALARTLSSPYVAYDQRWPIAAR